MANQTEKTNEATQLEASSDAPSSAWEMARSLLMGIDQTLEQARKELHEKQAANPGLAYTSRAEQMLIEALLDAKANIEPDLRQIARANRRCL